MPFLALVSMTSMMSSLAPAPVARLVARMPAGFAWVQGGKQNPEGSSFRKGAPYPAKSFCGPCGRKRFPASLQESRESRLSLFTPTCGFAKRKAEKAG